MPLNEKHDPVDGEVDLGDIFRTIWFQKFTILIFVILSFPISVAISINIKPTYKAETVFEKPQGDVEMPDSNLVGSNILPALALLGSSNINNIEDPIFSVIRSDSFLQTVIIENPNLDNGKFEAICPLPNGIIPSFSVRSILVRLGLSENNIPNENQKLSLLAKCVNKMLDFENDFYEAVTTSAYRLSVTSRDPAFSANLANQIVEKYFLWHKKRKDIEFRNVKNYLSKVISEAQLEVKKARELLQGFIIKNTLLMNIDPFSTSTQEVVFQTESASPFKFELNREITNLSQLEKSRSELQKASLILDNLKEETRDKLQEFITSTKLQGVLSRTFVGVISKIDRLSDTSSPRSEIIKRSIVEELKNLDKQIAVVEYNIRQKEEKTKKLMIIESTFQDLSINLQKQTVIFEGLKDQLKERMFLSEFGNITEPVLLTKAVTPFTREMPNRKFIVVLGALLSVVIGVAFALIRQVYLKRIYSLAQLKGKLKNLSSYRVNFKQLKRMCYSSGESVISQAVFSNAKGKGKLGCIIDISLKNRNDALATIFSKAFVNLLAVDNLAIAYFDRSKSKKRFSFHSEPTSVSEKDDLNPIGNVNKNIQVLNDESGLIDAGEFEEIRKKYSDSDKIICALGNTDSDQTKFNFIEKCDFYILIGNSFWINEFNLNKFFNNVLENEKKCLGFFLID